ncbi:hypothetical protein CR205_17100 [Alteribacter lacisalsi]|jgi:ATP synthase protein I|uniref:ATP synthase subunit I n=1 Tax=Alteribacter lacisalsi TaxID=2045244 RepID=A0A2W0H4J3_9BACI|nr:ATP synthase subunit I [Alteribacter lacisalsi]PYZ96087.1 hypothetical protein CR205_17100 [Alteribacter lacisalsi]
MEFGATAKRMILYTVALLALIAILAFTTPYNTFFYGMLLGTAFSLLNLYMTYAQVKRVTSESKALRTKFAFGTVSRIAVSVICIVIAVSFPHIFNLAGAIIGLMLTYAIIMIEPIFHIKRLQ